MHTHVCSCKLGPGFALLAKVCPWTSLIFVSKATRVECLPKASLTFVSMAREYERGKYDYAIDLLLDWFGIICMKTDNFCFYFQNRLIQTSQTGGQQYSDTFFPFNIPWCG